MACGGKKNPRPVVDTQAGERGRDETLDGEGTGTFYEEETPDETSDKRNVSHVEREVLQVKED